MALFLAAATTFLSAVSSAAPPSVELYRSQKVGRERLERQDDLQWEAASKDVQLDNGDNSSDVKVFVLTTTGRKQTVEGFGGAITDSTAYVYNSLAAEDQEAVIEALFGESGNRLTLMRVPIGPSDFATSLYSYDENDGNTDLGLANFSVAHDDAYIVPMIKDAMASAAGRTSWSQAAPTGSRTSPTEGDEATQVRILATPWTAPSWMKRDGLLRNSRKPGLVQTEDVFRSYAAYVSAFVDAYAQRNLSVWAVTVQNEPHVAGQFLFTYPCNGFEGSDEGAFLGGYLGPLLRENHPGLKIFVHDDQKEQQPNDNFMVDRVNDILAAADKAAIQKKKDGNGAEYVDGAAFHWYGNNLNNYGALEEVHSQHPELTLLATEATLKWPSLRKWQQAVKYAIDIIGDLNHWSSGWIEWNVLLDGTGGPTCIGPGVDTKRTPGSSTTCTWDKLRNASFGACDAPVRAIIQGSGGGSGNDVEERLHFGDQYYMLGHFSRFIPPSSTVLNTSSSLLSATARPRRLARETGGDVPRTHDKYSFLHGNLGTTEDSEAVAALPDNNPEGLMTTAVETPSGDFVVVCLNQQPVAVNIRLEIPDNDAYTDLVLPFSLPANAIATLVLPKSGSPAAQ